MKRLLSIPASAALFASFSSTPVLAMDGGNSGDMQKNNEMRMSDMKKDDMNAHGMGKSGMNLDKGKKTGWIWGRPA